MFLNFPTVTINSDKIVSIGVEFYKNKHGIEIDTEKKSFFITYESEEIAKDFYKWIIKKIENSGEIVEKINDYKETTR